MSWLEALLSLYRLSLHPPDAEHAEGLRAWLGERQRLLTRVELRPGALPTSIERGLIALVLHADRSTLERLLRCRNQLGQHLRALPGGLFSDRYPSGRSRGFFG